MAETEIPAACKALSADSLPEPGPLSQTCVLLIPCSIAPSAALAAVICAANGVDFLEPLNPLQPALDQLITFPDKSVMVMTVLLNVA